MGTSVVNLALLNKGTGAGAKFWKNFDKKYVNEYVSNYLDDNNMRSTVQANFDKFYTACYPSWAAKDDKANRPGLTQVSFTTSSDDNTSSNSFKITNQKDSFIEVFDECIRKIDINQSVHKFLSSVFNIYMYEHVNKPADK